MVKGARGKADVCKAVGRYNSPTHDSHERRAQLVRDQLHHAVLGGHQGARPVSSQADAVLLQGLQAVAGSSRSAASRAG